MIGIIRNDLINIRKSFFVSILIIIFSQLVIILNTASGKIHPSNSLFIILVLFVVFSSAGRNTLDIDEKSKANTLYKIMPITSKDYVRAKYIGALILDIFVFLANSIIIYIAYRNIKAISITINLFLIFGIYSFLSFPIYLKYRNKAILIILALIFFIYILYMNFISGFNSFASIFLEINLSIQAILALVFILSYILGEKITLNILEERFKWLRLFYIKILKIYLRIRI